MRCVILLFLGGLAFAAHAAGPAALELTRTIDVIDQRNADTYQLREWIPTRPGARTSCYSKDPEEFYLAVPQRGNQPAELRVFLAPK